MLFQISYCLIRAFPVLLTCFLFDFSLHFATFVYTFILCVFFYLYPSFFFPRLLHIILYSYSFYFLFTELILTRFLPPKTFFPAFSLGLFLATFSFILFHKFLSLCLFLLHDCLSIHIFHRFVSFQWLSPIFFLHSCYFPSRFCPFFCHCLLSIPHQVTAWFPYCQCNKCHAILNHISYGTHFSLCLWLPMFTDAAHVTVRGLQGREYEKWFHEIAFRCCTSILPS